MSTWQVAAVGWDFMKDGVQHDCELLGLVRANNPSEAFSKVCSIAMQDYPELQQATGPFPRPVINADEIQEVPETQLVGVDHVELIGSRNRPALGRNRYFGLAGRTPQKFPLVQLIR